MELIISSHSAKAKSHSTVVIASLIIIMIYLMVVVANYPGVPKSIINLPAQEQGLSRISEVRAPLPVPAPPSTHSQVVTTPIPPEPVQVILRQVPQAIPTPRSSQIP